MQHARSLATLPDVTDLTSTETKNEYNKMGGSGVREGAEGGEPLLSLNLIYPTVVPKLNCMNLLPQMPFFSNSFTFYRISTWYYSLNVKCKIVCCR
jgi:hypothetical protein